mmetsp:Transcript_25265/g.53664  ORF Transcript_25265/g.53664 Transcript_25265/m.53664 type:complete len:295 (-) Transcript_25265:235-1119(-)|eukprot:CAMPEP_0206602692 /NCGR_PEP_ID=MMETSP0325_2-20121206/47638_1 /ASSEMBLY_ACC=CAM_ASM_000347 /TAXON_ID=2866 /ORGANISM="Crypthecodinium cohnii, Strain Seligo" /LENGTH=294 /DNA_ID=CAMNT_0054115427 /DNA_START=44 /DNA_END=928 /DNA_ORIENTATION=+
MAVASASASNRSPGTDQAANDEAIARSLAMAEQEMEDRQLAQLLARQGSGSFGGLQGSRHGGSGGTAAGGPISMKCEVCETVSQIAVPPGAAPGAMVQAACPACSTHCQFRLPGSPSRSVAPPPPPRGGSAGYVGSNGSSASRSSGLFASPPSATDMDSPYVACEIGGMAIEMLVDTGAQTSVISQPLVRQLNLMSHLDTSHQGIAAGVGRARILGRLRDIPVKLGHVEFQLDFTVLGVEDPLLILGIDQMRRFRCVVDLERQVLLFGGRDGVEVEFLRNPQRPRMRQLECTVM